MDLHRYDDALAESSTLIAANLEFPVFYAMSSELYRHLGNQDGFVADLIKVMRKSERPERAEAFAAGYRKAKLNGGCAALIEILKNQSQKSMSRPTI
jgi:hypothetical protein